jgi:hypothetical protein
MDEDIITVPADDNTVTVSMQANVIIVPVDPPEQDDGNIVVDHRGPSWF